MEIHINPLVTDSDEMMNASDFIPIISDESIDDSIELNEKTSLPILPLRNMVLFPGVVIPVAVARKKSLKLIRNSHAKDGIIGVCTQKLSKTEDPTIDDLHRIGTVAKIIRVLEMPDDTTTVILEGKNRFSLNSIEKAEPFLLGNISTLEDKTTENDDKVFSALIEAIKDLANKIIKNSPSMPQEMGFAIRNIDNYAHLINYICGNFGLKVSDKQTLLEFDDVQDRGYQLLELLSKESQLLELKVSIQAKAKEDIDQQQREYFLQQQIKTIQDELGDSRNLDIEEYRKKSQSKKWSKEIANIFEKEISKLERMHPSSPDFSVQCNYVETILDIPWGEYTKDNLNINRAQKILNRDHFGMEKVKERILEHLAVLKLKNNMKSPIICLYGSPGVGKTSLGRSIAESLNRKYIRVSLGGLHDEAEIRGHRRTYIGAMPGRIVQNLIKCGSSNPVFILDEIDKINPSANGDPASALLEVLDPEQNNTFHDNFLDIDIDLSNVMFIATANDISTIPRPLLDRMELIEVSGYVTEEKIEIASKHLWKKKLEENGLTEEDVIIQKPIFRNIIDSYTRESGVRELDRKLAKLLRHVAKKKAIDKNFTVEISTENLQEYLGPVEYTKDSYQGNDYYGVVTGLAWTAVGGEILYVESSINKANSPGKLSLTGNLGDVMKESAILALEYIKSHCEELNIKEDVLEKHNIHIHVPEGAIPKDGPSAGITMATSLASTLLHRKVKKALAMTGEITLRGKVLPVGGIREKILAAKRANITELILCKENKKDIDEIKPSYIKGLKFHYVSDIKEVLNIALI